MKMTMSKDGVMRATVAVKYRISDEDRKVIAFVADRKAQEDERPTPKIRLATRKEIVDAILSGYKSDMEWGGEYAQEFWDLSQEGL